MKHEDYIEFYTKEFEKEKKSHPDKNHEDMMAFKCLKRLQKNVKLDVIKEEK